MASTPPARTGLGPILPVRTSGYRADVRCGGPARRMGCTHSQPNCNAVDVQESPGVSMYRELDRSTGNVIRINYNLDGHPVCLGTWSAFYGVAKSTAEIIDRNVRRGDTIWNDGLLKEAKLQKQAAKAPLLAAATEWWYTSHSEKYRPYIVPAVPQDSGKSLHSCILVRGTFCINYVTRTSWRSYILLKLCMGTFLRSHILLHPHILRLSGYPNKVLSVT